MQKCDINSALLHRIFVLLHRIFTPSYFRVVASCKPLEGHSVSTMAIPGHPSMVISFVYKKVIQNVLNVSWNRDALCIAYMYEQFSVLRQIWHETHHIHANDSIYTACPQSHTPCIHLMTQ